MGRGTMNQYTHRYSLTAADMDTRYRMTPKAIRCLTIHWLKETFLGDTLTCRLNLLPNETDEPVYHYLHTIARNDAETAAQVYSEWIPRSV
ncbi:MAG: hypothetical protein SPF23_02460, partial [Paludibacteraceae bacterium]|nr:hypothetical protein [Paludibacteraceae bacterium]